MSPSSPPQTTLPEKKVEAGKRKKVVAEQKKGVVYKKVERRSAAEMRQQCRR